MKIDDVRYSGKRLGPPTAPAEDRAVEVRCNSEPLRPCANDGFDWGRHCNAATELALAILLDFLQERTRAEQLSVGFAWEVVRRWPTEDFTIDGRSIRIWIENTDESALRLEAARQTNRLRK